ncbi:MAG: 1,4-alpha-glucan branching protein, partial [Armatimonadetes bacterium]|nr:1,4-alpha-glucan branching protein [Armatimonadota bacterium]
MLMEPGMPGDVSPAATEPEPIGLIQNDPWLESHREALQYRIDHYRKSLARIESSGGLLGPISQGHQFFGFNRGESAGQAGVWYREWAPGAEGLFLTGDFNDWSRTTHPLTRGADGVWSLFLPDAYYAERLTHGSRLKAHVVAGGTRLDRLPAYARRVIQEEGGTDFTAQLWLPTEPYRFRHEAPPLESALRIYETHAGMAQEEARVGTFREFTATVLPRIQELGYNTVQLMAVMEHPYYGSFGYHVSSFFAVSSR